MTGEALTKKLVGISARFDIIIPVEIEADTALLDGCVIGELEGVPIVDGEAYAEVGEAAAAALTEKDQVVEILGEILGKAYRIKTLCPNWDKVEYIINAPMEIIR